MLDSKTRKEIENIFAQPEEMPANDITPPKKIASKISNKLLDIPTQSLCIMHTFIVMELKKRGIEFQDE